MKAKDVPIGSFCVLVNPEALAISRLYRRDAAQKRDPVLEGPSTKEGFYEIKIIGGSGCIITDLEPVTMPPDREVQMIKNYFD